MRMSGPRRILWLVAGVLFFLAGCQPILVREREVTVLVPVTRIAPGGTAERPEAAVPSALLTTMAESARPKVTAPEGEKTPPPAMRTASARGEKGGAEGLTFWNDAPLPGVKVKLCQDWGEFTRGGDCRGQEFAATSDGQGRYQLANVPVGYYFLATRYPGEDTSICWNGPFATGCTPWVAIEAGKKAKLPKMVLVKHDLELVSPADGEEVAGASITLQWKAYPQAASYEVYLRRVEPWQRVLLENTRETSLAVPTSLEAGEYWWDVNAFNARGTQIAQTQRFVRFRVR